MRAADALRATPAGPTKDFDLIVSRARRWLSVVSRHFQPPYARSADYEQHRVSRLKHRIGFDESGHRQVLGIDLEFVDWADAGVTEIVPSLLEDNPLVNAIGLFEVEAVAFAINSGRRPVWDNMRWLCLLNELDPAETEQLCGHCLTKSGLGI
jgi:hypothetical protein